MYLLQSGIQTTAKIDLSSWQNILAIGGVIFLLLITIGILLKVLNIFSIGPLRRENKGKNSEHFMTAENNSHDKRMERTLREYTTSMRARITNSFRDIKMCSMTRRALSSGLRFPLYTSVSNNNFSEVLMPPNIAEYRAGILSMMKDEYDDIYFASLDMPCNQDKLLPWAEVESRIMGFIDEWIKTAKVEKTKACKSKIVTYQHYLEDFELSDDKDRVRMVKELIAKNEKYVGFLV
jgi:hypothetical protein